MPPFWKHSRSAKSGTFFPEQQHPDLPLPRARPPPIQRSTSVNERQSAAYSPDNRRSIAILPSSVQSFAEFTAATSASEPPLLDDPASAPSSSLARSRTVLRRDGSARSPDLSSASPGLEPARGSPSPLWSPDFEQLPAPSEQQELYRAAEAAMHHGANSKTSSDSGQNVAMDRWSQRRLQRLNTEHAFRDQRQGGGQVLSPPASDSSSYNPSSNAVFPGQDAQPQSSMHQQTQPQQGSYQAGRSTPSANQHHSQPVSSTSRSQQNYPIYEAPAVTHVQSQPHQYSPPDSASLHPSDNSRPQLQQAARSYSQQSVVDDQQSMAASNNGNLPAPKAGRSVVGNRQSVHNGLASRESSGLGQQQAMPSFSAQVVPPATQGQSYRADQTQPPPPQAEVRRATPQPAPVADDLSEDDVAQLVKDHKELREKYTKVKKYYFEKEDQVKQLQNSLAHQRLSQSRTSLDDSEYSTRFNRLDGLVAQLAFSIRKSWKSIPSWLVTSVNKDAVATGKQEMTAAGRAFISCWLVEEVFDKYFHPDLESTLSAQLRSIQKNIRRFAPPAQTSEEEEYLTAKVVNWRLSTLEGLQEALRSPQCPTNRAQLTDALKEGLISALAVHLQDPPPSDLEGGVHMIIELVVSIAIHLPLESRDVVIEYFMPGHGIVSDQMKVESGIPPLTVSIADDAADRASMKSAASDITDMTDHDGTGGQSKKRSMLSALTGDRKSKSAGKSAGASGSSSSLHRPESSHGKEDLPPRVRMAAGIGVSVRGRTVLVKAPIFST